MSTVCQCGTVSLLSYLPYVQAHIDRDCLASAVECGNKCGVKVARGLVRCSLSGFLHFCVSNFLNMY